MSKFYKRILFAVIFLVMLFANVSFANEEANYKVVFTIPQDYKENTYYNLYSVDGGKETEITSVREVEDPTKKHQTSHIHGSMSPSVLTLKPGVEYYVNVSNPDTIVKLVPLGNASASMEFVVTDSEDIIAEDSEPELYEKIFAGTITWIGERLNQLVAVIAKEDITIDSIVFDQYKRIQLTFFNNDLKYYR